MRATWAAPSDRLRGPTALPDRLRLRWDRCSDLHSPLAWSHGTENMVIFTGHYGGDVVFSGHGAGGNPTAVAVVSDLLALAHGSRRVEIPSAPAHVSAEFEVPHYIRFLVADRPGIVAEITGALAKDASTFAPSCKSPAIRNTHCLSWSPSSRASLRPSDVRWKAFAARTTCSKHRWTCRCWSSKTGIRVRDPGSVIRVFTFYCPSASTASSKSHARLMACQYQAVASTAIWRYSTRLSQLKAVRQRISAATPMSRCAA